MNRNLEFLRLEEKRISNDLLKIEIKRRMLDNQYYELMAIQASLHAVIHRLSLSESLTHVLTDTAA